MGKHTFTSKFSTHIGQIVAGLAVALALQSCLTRGTDEAGVYGENPADLSNVNFQMLQRAVIGPSCIHCHGEFSNENALLSEVTPGDPDHSMLYQKLMSGEMPKGAPKLSSALLSIVRAYIQKVHAGPSLPPIAPTWTSLEPNLINQSCIRCHNTGGKWPSMATYEKVADHSYDMALEMFFGHMPPTGHTPPSPEVKQAFIDWINADFPK